MLPPGWDGLVWLLLLLGPLLFLQRQLHREMQSVFLLLVRRAEIAVAIFSLFLLPGVILHEGSHYLMARLLGVKTGRFSIIPRPLGQGRLQLGFVETVPADPLRDALIGAAPLLSGGLFVAYAGLARLGLTSVWDSLALSDWQALPAVVHQPDFWLWFYLLFAVSSTMLPSAADRRAWLPLSLALALLVGIGLLAGAGPWLAAHLAQPFNQVLRAVAVVFGISVVVHLVLLLPVFLIRRALNLLTGLEVT